MLPRRYNIHINIIFDTCYSKLELIDKKEFMCKIVVVVVRVVEEVEI
jgi:hypothetical protein